MTTVEPPPLLSRLHDALVVLLVALRPWCWDGAPGQAADLLWQALAVGAFALVAIERATLLRQAWRWSWRGWLAVGVILALAPAVWAAPEQAPAFSRWTGWVACLAGAGYLLQALPGRTSLALAALVGGCALTAVLGVMQAVWVLPAMATAHAAGAAMFEAMPGQPATISERIANGGVFATFTLSNQLGAYLALTVPVIGWLAWRAAGGARAVLVVVAAIGLVALALTNAKGAWLALAAGLGVGWWLAWPGRWWRWLPLPLGALGVVGVLWSGAADGSIAVRAGYWRAALTLAGEAPLTGQGLGAFAAHQPRVLAVGDEPTRYVHNEVLEAVVAGGWPVGLLLLAGLVVLAWPRRPAELEPQTGHPALLWLLAGAVPYLALLGAFDGNLGWWPGGGDFLMVLVWAVLLGLLTAWIATRVVGLPLPPPWVATAGLTAVGLKALIDFDLHAAGILGTAVAVAVLAAGPAATAGVSAVGRWLPAVGAAAAAGFVVAGLTTGLRLAEADDWIAQGRMASRPEAAVVLAHQLGLDPTTPPAALAAAAGGRAIALAEGAPGTLAAALEMMPPSPPALEFAGRLAQAAPHSAAIALHHARRLGHARDFTRSVEEAERATTLTPTSPRVLATAAAVLEQAATALPARAEALRRRAADLRAESARLLPLVHPSMR